MEGADDIIPKHTMIEPDERIGRLRGLREGALLSQAQLAAQSGVSDVTIGRLERGSNAPRESTIQKLAAALGVPPQELFREKDK